MNVTYNVNLKYFASIREAIGQGGESIATQATTLKALRDELIARGGAHAEVLAHGRAVRMALNQDLCNESAVLTEGCEVAFFPPVTGG
ncbi:molybdopterin converting factor subunit 1 [Limnohabitans sp. Jir61]|uniref:molybdopterin converting factor subunit 1 n=1 Tax=Limnohabitans sp. Jir61 TaxID=1826168 RepID=UPI000D3AA13C|nr:molybdopterin converting factor subunit 1 [Limnohabitans sp. Jir61]PUE32709.1 molybdopterin converting factor subunit 1 [Limnohabitans sp. Jir61]